MKAKTKAIIAATLVAISVAALAMLSSQMQSLEQGFQEQSAALNQQALLVKHHADKVSLVNSLETGDFGAIDPLVLTIQDLDLLSEQVEVYNTQLSTLKIDGSPDSFSVLVSSTDELLALIQKQNLTTANAYEAASKGLLVGEIIFAVAGIMAICFLLFFVLIPLTESLNKTEAKWLSVFGNYQKLQKKEEKLVAHIEKKNQIIHAQKQKLGVNLKKAQDLLVDKKTLSKSFDRLKSQQDVLVERLKGKENDQQKLENELEQSRSTLEKLHQANEGISSNQSALREELKDLQNSLEAKNQTLQLMWDDLKNSKDMNEEYAHLQSKAASLETECKSLEESLKEKKAVLTNQETEISQNKTKYDEIQEEFNMMNLEYHAAKEEKNYIKERLAEKTDQISSIQGQLQEMQAELAKLEQQKQQLANEKEALQQSARAKEAELNEALTRVNQEQESNKRLAEEKSTLQQRFDELSSSSMHNMVNGNSGGSASWSLDLSSNLFQYSEDLSNLLGYTQAELGNGQNPLQKHIHPSDRKAFSNMMEALKEGKIEKFQHQWRLLSKDGATRYAQLIAAPKAADSKIEGMVQVIGEATETKNQLRDLSLISDKVDDAIMILDATGKVEWVNKNYESLSGFQSSDLVGQTIADLYPEVKEKIDVWNRNATHSSAEIFQQEYLKTAQNGDLHWVMMSISAECTPQGDVAKYILIERDIDQLRKQEEKLSQMSEVVENTENFVAIVENTGKLIWSNKQFNTLFGTSKNRSFLTQLEQNGANEQALAELSTSLKGKQSASFDLGLNETDQLFSLTVNPKTSMDSENDHFFIIGREVTTERRLNEELKVTQGELTKIQKQHLEQVQEIQKKDERLTDALKEAAKLETELVNMNMLVDKSEQAISYTDENGNLQWANEAFTKLTGYTQEEAEGIFMYKKLMGQKTDSVAFRSITKGFRSGKAFKAELFLENKQGNSYFTALKAVPLFDEDNEVERFLIMESDLTTQKELEERLDNLSNIADKVPNAVVVVDTEGEIEWANQVFVQSFSAKNVELGEVHLDEVIKEDGFSFRKSVLSKSKDKTLSLGTAENQKHYTFSVSDLFDDDQEVIKHIIIFSDVTAAEQANQEIVRAEEQHKEAVAQKEELDEKLESLEKELASSLERNQEQSEELAATIQRAPIGISIVNARGFYEEVNEEFCTIYGYTSGELIGKHFTTLVKPSDVTFWKKRHESFISGKREPREEMTVISKDGRELTILSESARIMDAATEEVRKISYVIDLTDQKRLEQEIKDSEEQMRNLMDDQFSSSEELIRKEKELQKALEESQNLSLVASKTDNAVIISDRDGLVEYVNPGFERITGYSSAEVIGKKPGSFLQGVDTNPDHVRAIRQGLLSKRPFTQEILNYSKSNKPYWLSISMTPILDARGEVEKFIAIERDITEEKAREEELSKLSLVASKTDNAVIITDKDGAIEYVNQGFERITEYKSHEVMGKKPGSFLQGPDTNPDHVRAIRRGLDSGKPFKQEVYNYSKSGRGYWLQLSINPIFDAMGYVEKFIAIETDITEQKNAEAEMQKLSLVASKTDNAVIITSKDGAIEWVNEGFERVTEYRLNEVIGKKPGTFLQGEKTNPEDVDAIRKGLKSGKPFTHEIYNYSKTGRGYWLQLSINPIFDNDGQIEKFIAIESDITDRKQLEEEMQESEEQMRELMDNQFAESEALMEKEKELRDALERSENLGLVAAKTDNAVIITDAQGRALFVNDGFERITGYKAEEVMGKIPGRLLQGKETNPAHVKAIRRGLDSKKPFTQEILNYTKQGIPYWLNISITPVLDERGQVEKFVAIENDITEQKKAQEEMQNLSLVAKETDNAVIITDAQGLVLWVNEGFTKVTEYTLDEVIGTKPGQFLQGDKTNIEDKEAIRAGLDSKRPFKHEIYNYSKSGRGYWLSLSISPIFDDNGDVEKFIAIESDITERKQLEEEIKESEDTMRGIMDSQFEASELLMKKEKELSKSLELSENLSLVASKTDNAVVITSREGKIQYVNAGFERITGYKKEEVMGKIPGRFLQGPDTNPDHIKAIRAGLDSKKPFEQEILNYSKKGVAYWLNISITPILDEKGEVEKFIAIESDITERKAEEEQMKSLSIVASKTDNAVIITDAEGKVEWVNEGFTQVTEYTLEEVAGKKPGAFLQGEKTREEDRETIREGLASHKPFKHEIYNYSKSGRGYWLSLSISPIFDEAGELEKFVAIESDITEQKELEEELKSSESEMRVIMDKQFEASEELMKKEQELNKALEEEKKRQDELDRAMESLKNTQSQMVQNEKMASVGQLTAGIAHEINNPINFVYNGIDSLKMSLDDLMQIINKYNELGSNNAEQILTEVEGLKKKLRYERLMKSLPTVIDDIKSGANRTIEIVKGLRVFSRLDEEDQKPANINECLDSTLILLRNKTKDNVQVKKYFDEHIGEIMCYPGQLNQVFMNLMTNAIQAIPEERTDGELMIYTENLKDSVIIRILDNGDGIPEDVKKRIFEPFYTTKAVGIGTGLGLSISYGIIEKHDGKIYVNSEVGKGTEFVIELPKEAKLVSK